MEDDNKERDDKLNLDLILGLGIGVPFMTVLSCYVISLIQ